MDVGTGIALRLRPYAAEAQLTTIVYLGEVSAAVSLGGLWGLVAKVRSAVLMNEMLHAVRRARTVKSTAVILPVPLTPVRIV